MSSEVVSNIIEMYKAQKSLRAIASTLNEQGVATTQGGAKWHASTISKVIKTNAA
jgi:hypothetical protein